MKVAKEKHVKSDDLTRYFEESQGLERDYVGEILKSRKKAWYIGFTGLTLGFLGLLSAGFQYAQPLPPPVVLVLNKTTGAVNQLTSVADLPMSEREARDRAELYRYVLDRESYDWFTIQTSYEVTGLKSAPEVADEYANRFKGPDGLDVKLGKYWRIVPSIISIEIRRQTQRGGDAFIRFSTQKIKDDGTKEPAINWATTVAYEYQTKSMRLEDRLKNYLGFTVVTYRAAPELAAHR